MAERAARRAVAAAMALASLARPAHARVQEYQIIRLLSYTTSCELTRLEDRSAPKGPIRFFALCGNVTFYPDGIDILCTDRDDDRTCTATTKAQNFDPLQLLSEPHRGFTR